MLAFYAVVMLSLVVVQPLFAYFWLIQLVLVVVVAVLAWQNYHQVIDIITIELSDSGRVAIEQDQQWLSFNIQAHSLVSDWFCLLRLISATPLDTSTKRYIWLWRDCVDDDSYRRVCRAILQVKSE